MNYQQIAKDICNQWIKAERQYRAAPAHSSFRKIFYGRLTLN